ncbi:tetratricopeptide repeat protein [Neptunomonas marina]|uniref:Tetratricopeptide repeat protein n=2 Tax=Neptunomonas marina TaxID=1815562 RepID=A0A437Q9S3_9GAMM|nr:tetratricopeptide repeat protein [Neptunomonas marina]
MSMETEFDEQQPFIRKRYVFILLLVIVGALWVTYNQYSSRQLSPVVAAQKAPSQVSSAYLKAETLTQPDNADAALLRAQDLIDQGKYTQASALLEPLVQRHDTRAERLQRAILYGAWASVSGADKHELELQIRSTIKGLTPAQVTADDLAVARALGMNRWLSFYYEAQGDLLAAAQALLAAGDGKAAITLFDEAVTPANLMEGIALAQAAGQHERAIEWLQRYPEALPDYYDQLLKLAEVVGRTDLTSLPDNLFPAHFEQREKWLEPAINSRIAAGDLAGARQLVDQVVESRPSDSSLRYRRWQLQLWLGHPELATQDGAWLLAHAPSEDVFNETIRQGWAAYEYEQLTQYYRDYTQTNRIRDPEIGKWVEAHELAGTPEMGITDLRNYAARFGYSQMLLDWEIHLLERTGNMADMPDKLSVFKQVGLANSRQYHSLAMAFALKRDYANAYHVLASAPLAVMQDDEDYWSMLAEMAWRIGDERAIARSYAELIKRGEAQETEKARYLEAKFGKNVESKLDWLWQDFDKAPDASKLIQIASLTSRSDRDADIKRLAQAVDAFRNEPASSDVYTVLGQLALASGDIPQAEQYLDHAIELNPNNVSAHQSLGWLYLEKRDEALMRPFYYRWSDQWPNQDWRLLLAGMSDALGLDRQAIFLYQKSLANDSDNIAILYQLSEVLLRTDQIDASWRIRRYIASRLSKLETMPDYIADAVIEQFFGSASAAAFAARRWLQQSSEEADLALLRLLGEGRSEFGRYMFGRQVWHEIDLPGWFQLSQALQRNDTQRIAALLKELDPNALPTLDRIAAMRKMGLFAEAFQLAEKQLEDQDYPANQKRQLFSEWYGLRRYHNRSFSASYSSNRDDDERLRLTLNFPWRNLQVSAELEQYKYRRREDTERINWQLSLQRFFADSEYGLQVSGDNAELGSRVGATFTYRAQMTPYLVWGVEAGFNEENKQNKAFERGAAQHRVAMTAEYQISARTRASAKAALLRYLDRDQHTLSDGAEISLQLSESLAAGHTHLEIYGDVTAQFFDKEGVLGKPDERRPLVLDPYQRIAAGVRVGQGYMGQRPLVHSANPRWEADLSVGYRPKLSRFDYAAKAQIGWRLSGDDQLSLGVEHQSKPRSGRDSSEVKLDYTKQF